jgi:hypothetical protein
VDATTGSPVDWPAVGETNEATWRAACERPARAQAAFADTVGSFGDARLSEAAVGCAWTNHRMIHGTIHHDVYHAGQIGLLRRMLGGRS